VAKEVERRWTVVIGDNGFAVDQERTDGERRDRRDGEPKARYKVSPWRMISRNAPILCRRAKTRKLSCPLRARGQGAFAGEGQTWLAQRHNGLMETALQRVQSQRLCAPEEPWTTNLGPLVRRPLRRPLPACLFPENGTGPIIRLQPA
jgi:hypothetical protein